jgi:hypothetical protein
MSAVSGASAGTVICLNANQQYSPTAPLDVKVSLTIQTDPTQLTIAGNRAATISGSLVAGGAGNLDPNLNDVIVVGGGNNPTLTLHNIVETQAIQQSNGGVVVLSGGTALIDHSLFSGNTSNAIDVKTGGSATITNSTITNSIQGFDGILLGGTATLNEDTIAGNAGDGIDKTAAATATVNNTILSGNTLANCNSSTGLTGSHSGSSDATCGATITTGGFNNVSAGLGSLANNGGPTNTIAVTNALSPAINNGTAAPTGADDQRGFLRGATPTIGAFEFGATAPATLTVIKHVVGPGSASSFQLTVTGGSANPGTFPGAESPGTPVAINSNTGYSINETGPAGYTASASGNCASPPAGGLPATGTSGAAGTNVTCTITNTAMPTQLTVFKQVVNTGCSSSCGAPADFTMTVTDITNNNTVLASFPGNSAGSPPVAVPAGHAYSVTEVADAAQAGKYQQSTGAGCSGVATVNGTVSCTMTNTYITCQVAQDSGPQPAPGSASAGTCVNANISATIEVTTQFASITFPALAVGQTSASAGDNVTVYTNDSNGYDLTVKRTRFYPVATAANDQILSISASGLPAGGFTSFLSPFTGALAAIPSDGTSLNLGNGSHYTTVNGDVWPFSFVLGPIQFGPPAGQYQSIVTFTAVGL